MITALLSLIFIAFGGLGVEELLGAAAALATTGGAWPAPFLAEVTLSGGQAGLGVIGLVVTLIGYHFVISRYIREQAGVRPTSSIHVEGQPLQTEIAGKPTVKTEAVARLVAHEELTVMLRNYVTSDDLHGAEQRLDSKIEANFRDLDGKRSKSIGNLHEHLTGSVGKLHDKIDEKFTEANNASAENAERLDDRINALAGVQGELRGELRQVNENVGRLVTRLIGGGNKG